MSGERDDGQRSEECMRDLIDRMKAAGRGHRFHVWVGDSGDGRAGASRPITTGAASMTEERDLLNHGVTDSQVRAVCLDCVRFRHPGQHVAAAQLAYEFVTQEPAHGLTRGQARSLRLDALKRAAEHAASINDTLVAARLYFAFVIGEATVSPDALGATASELPAAPGERRDG